MSEDLGGSFIMFEYIAFLVMFVYRMRENNFKQEPTRVPKGENMDVPANVGESLLNSGPPS